MPRHRSGSTSKNIVDSSTISGASIPPDVLTLQTATPTRLVADSSRTKKTRSESGKCARPVRSDAAHPRARDEGGRFRAIRYVAGDQSSPRSRLARKLARSSFILSRPTDSDIPNSLECLSNDKSHRNSQTPSGRVKGNSFAIRLYKKRSRTVLVSLFDEARWICRANENDIDSLLLPGSRKVRAA